jgi:ferritin
MNNKNMEKIVPFSLFEGIENEGRLSEKITKILNDQIKNELQSSQIYRGMTCWLDNAGWNDAAKYFFKSSQEELIHMDKIYQYLFDKNVMAKVPTTEEVKQKFESIREVVEESLKHEIEVTKKWEEISKSAEEDNDNTTYEFAQWFLKEQTEEENKFRDVLDKMNLDLPKYEIEYLFKDLLK